VRRGPSADGAPLSTLTVTFVAGGSGATGRKASQRPGWALFTKEPTSRSALAVAASTSCTLWLEPAARRRTCGSSFAGSIRWSNSMKTVGSRRAEPPAGWERTTVSGGVAKVKLAPWASVPPPLARVPAGTSMRYSVAMGNRSCGWNRSVRVPIQRHVPVGVGVKRTGTVAAASACDVTATMGWEKVTERLGARGTSPSGEWRRTVSGSAGAPPGAGGAPGGGAGGGNVSLIVWPGRGGGNERSRSASSLASAGSFGGGPRRARRRVTAAAPSGVAGGVDSRGATAASSTPSDSS